LLWRFYNCKRRIFSKGEEDKKGMEGMNGSKCLLLLLLAFDFYKELYSLGISVCLFILLSFSFIGAD